MLCKSYLLCSGGICRKYGAILNGQASSSNLLCKSGFRNASTGLCAKGPRLIGKMYVDHMLIKCNYSDGSTANAECYHQKDGKAICHPGAGNLEVHWEALLKFLEKKPECNPFTYPFSMCEYTQEQVGIEYHRAAIAYWKITHSLYIEDLSDCMQKYGFPEYYNALRALNGAVSISALVGLLLGVLLLI